MVKVALNIAKPNNYAFFCPISRLHLTRSNPIGFANEVTQYILRGLRSKVLIDVDNKIDLESGKEKAGNQQQTPANPQPTMPEQHITPPVSEQTGEPAPEVPEPEVLPEQTAAPETEEPEKTEVPETVEPEKVETPEASADDVLPVDTIPAVEEKAAAKKGGRKKNA